MRCRYPSPARLQGNARPVGGTASLEPDSSFVHSDEPAMWQIAPMRHITTLVVHVCLALSLAGCSGGHLSVDLPQGGETLRLSFPPGETVEHRLPLRISGGVRPYQLSIDGCPDWVALVPDQRILAGTGPVTEAGNTFFCTFRVTESDPGVRPAQSVTHGLRLEVPALQILP